jgi:regulator of cell morphogenesis and NO signaling
MNEVISVSDSVGALVRQRPDRARVFESLSIDYCCGGKLPLAEACAQSGVDPLQVVEQLTAADMATAATDGHVDADMMSLTALADHIEQTHHAYLRTELPRLDQMTLKVLSVHGGKDPRLAQLREAFAALRDELMQHMMKEERILFPMVRQIELADGPVFAHCGSIANPIRQMELEHGHAGDALLIMRQATDGYVPPPWACNTYRAMLDALAQLEKDLHQHIHKENNVLFPKAIAREAELAETGAR